MVLSSLHFTQQKGSTKMPTEHANAKSWRWNKPVRWADIVRSALLLKVITDVNHSPKVRNILLQQIADRNIRQIGRGLYSYDPMPLGREAMVEQMRHAGIEEDFSIATDADVGQCWMNWRTSLLVKPDAREGEDL